MYKNNKNNETRKLQAFRVVNRCRCGRPPKPATKRVSSQKSAGSRLTHHEKGIGGFQKTVAEHVGVLEESKSAGASQRRVENKEEIRRYRGDKKECERKNSKENKAESIQAHVGAHVAFLHLHHVPETEQHVRQRPTAGARIHQSERRERNQTDSVRKAKSVFENHSFGMAMILRGRIVFQTHKQVLNMQRVGRDTSPRVDARLPNEPIVVIVSCL